LETVYARHVVVGDQEVRYLAFFQQQVQGLLAVFGLLDVVAEAVELRDDYPTYDPVVVDY